MTQTSQLPDRRSTSACFFGSWPAMPNNVARSRRDLLANLRAEEPDEATLDAIGTAVAEATTNAVYHAYVGRRIGQFHVTAEILDDQIAVTVEDDGCGFENDADVRAGRGLPLIASLADRVETTRRTDGGTVAAMWFARSR